MDIKNQIKAIFTLAVFGLLFCACGEHQDGHADGMEKHGETHEHGVVDFPISCNDRAQEKFEMGLGHLHHMMYDDSRPFFKSAAEADPECAMAYWGLAMTYFQPLWHPTSYKDLELGKDAIQRAIELGGGTDREAGFIEATKAFYTDPDPPAADRPGDHEARVKAWKTAQRDLFEKYPDNVDAGAFYALAEVCYAMTQFSPHVERDYSRELLAGEILEGLFEDHPDHPGLYHYLIHAYDSPKLAHKALEVSKEYDKLAPTTAHALHMPSHIFVRLGMWEETADLNERSAEAALNSPANGLTSLHYPHALDYMMYAYLQMNDRENAKRTLQKVNDIDAVQNTFASAYGIAAAQARYYMELQKWEDAVELEIANPGALDWDLYPGALALTSYARGLGAARSGNIEVAEKEAGKINDYVQSMQDEGNYYWAHMSDALGKAVEAWITFESGETEEALKMIKNAAKMEESMDKHPISPGEIFPVRELYGEMLMKTGHTEEARVAFETSLNRTPERRNALENIELLAEN